MAEDVPSNINEELVEKIWKSYYGNVVVTDTEISLVGIKGDNYSSIMCRAKSKVSINGEEPVEKRTVIKTLPIVPVLVNYVKEYKAFEKEAVMLSKCIPAMEKVLKSVDEPNWKLAAELYYHELTEDSKILAMEDLGVHGYAVRNRSQGLSLEECLRVAKSQACFHAASIVVLKNQPELKEILGEDSIWGPKNKDNVAKGLKAALDDVVAIVEKNAPGVYTEGFKRIQDNVPDVMVNCTGTLDRNYPVVLNHGDMWLNNLMFRKKESDEIELRYVDLQLSWINSPVFDLLYFLFTSPSPDVRIPHIETILRAYNDKFTEICKKLSLDIDYPYEKMMKDIKRNLPFGLCIFCYIFPLVSAPPNYVVDMNEIDEENGLAGNPVFQHPFFQKSLLLGLPYFVKEGVL